MSEKFDGESGKERQPEFVRGEDVTINPATAPDLIARNVNMELEVGGRYTIFGFNEEVGPYGNIIRLAYLGPAGADPERVRQFQPEKLFEKGYKYMAVYPVTELRKPTSDQAEDGL